MNQGKMRISLEKKLFLIAQKRADARGQTLRQYVIDLIACDLTSVDEAVNIPDVGRVMGLTQKVQKTTLDALKNVKSDKKSEFLKTAENTQKALKKSPLANNEKDAFVAFKPVAKQT
jgi:hypothetical protein